MDIDTEFVIPNTFMGSANVSPNTPYIYVEIRFIKYEIQQSDNVRYFLMMVLI